MAPEPFVISLGDHGQLLTQRENFHMEQGAASEEPSQRGKKGSEDRAHVTDANAGAHNKSTESTHTKLLVGLQSEFYRTTRTLPFSLVKYWG